MRLLTLLGLLACAACSPMALSDSAVAAPQGPRDPAVRYRNSDGSRIDKPWSEVLAWMWEATVKKLPPPPSTHVNGYDFPVVRDAQGTAPAPAEGLSVTWIGHATALIRLNGHTVLTAPHFSGRASPLSWVGMPRKVPTPYRVEALPHIDVVLISHDHYDHLDEPTVRRLAQQPGGPPVFLVPQGLGAWLAARGIAAEEVAWWQPWKQGRLSAWALPAHHWSGRGLSDRHTSHWAGWAVQVGAERVYYAGDTGYGADFADIGRRMGPFDLALIPVGAYEPRAFMKDQHVNPSEAVRIHQEVRAHHSLGVHWGTFELADEPLDAPLGELPRAAAEAGLAEGVFRLLKHGETWTLKGAVPGAPPPQAP